VPSGVWNALPLLVFLVLAIKSACNKLDSNFDTDSEIELPMTLVNQHPDACSNIFVR
jgi:hypothetical protein